MADDIFVTMKLKNCGYDTIKTADFSYKINSTVKSIENWNGAIAPGDTSSYQFNVSYKGQLGYYTITATSNVIGDDFHSNDFYGIILLGMQCPPPPGFEEEIYANLFLKFYPNPAQSKITIDLETIKRNNVLFLTFYNSSGKEVKRIDIIKPTKTIDIDISTLSPGLYYLLLQNSEEILGSGKFVKE